MEVVLVALLVLVAAAAIAWLLANRRRGGGPLHPLAVVPRCRRAGAAGRGSRRGPGQRACVARARHGGAGRGRAGGHVHPRAARCPHAGGRCLAGRSPTAHRAKLGEVQSVVHADLGGSSQLVQQLGEPPASVRPGRPQSLQVHAEITQSLAGTTSSLREALANVQRPRPVGRAHGRRRAAPGRHAGEGQLLQAHCGRRRGHAASPTSRSCCPRGTCCSWTSSSRWRRTCKFLEAGTEAERSAHRATFVRDVRGHVQRAGPARVRPGRRPAGGRQRAAVRAQREPRRRSSTSHDTGLVEEAMAQHVVICSPLTLFAFLGVIRQAFDNFMIEQTSQEILGLLGRFGQQWAKYTEQVDKVKQPVRHGQPVVRRAGHHPPPRSSSGRSTPSKTCARSSHVAIDGELFGRARRRPSSTTVRELSAAA